jgi:hypothetical protein
VTTPPTTQAPISPPPSPSRPSRSLKSKHGLVVVGQ